MAPGLLSHLHTFETVPQVRCCSKTDFYLLSQSNAGGKFCLDLHLYHSINFDGVAGVKIRVEFIPRSFWIDASLWEKEKAKLIPFVSANTILQ